MRKNETVKNVTNMDTFIYLAQKKCKEVEKREEKKDELLEGNVKLISRVKEGERGKGEKKERKAAKEVYTLTR